MKKLLLKKAYPGNYKVGEFLDDSHLGGILMKESIYEHPEILSEFYEEVETNYSSVKYKDSVGVESIIEVTRASDGKVFKIGDYITFNGMYGQKWETSKSAITGFGYRYIGNNPTGKIGIYYGSGFVDIDKLVEPKIKENYSRSELFSILEKLGYNKTTINKIMNDE